MHDYDRSSKWLIQHPGVSILRLGGVTGVQSWRPLQAELVQPRQTPDGLLEVHLADQLLVRAGGAERLAGEHRLAPLDSQSCDASLRRRCLHGQEGECEGN